MVYRRIDPVPALRDVVESVWLQDSEAAIVPSTPTCVVPTGTVELLFHYRDPLVHVEAVGVRRMPRFYITGQRTKPVFTSATGRVGIVIVSLHPWGSEAIFPGTAELVDAYTDLREFVPASVVSVLENRLDEADHDEARVLAVLNFLLRQRASRPTDARIVAAARALATGTQPTISRLSNELRMSRRHFARTFRSTIGLRPKVFSRIMRFQQAMRLRRECGMGWADIAADCGFSDQPHLIREVREFSACSPTEMPRAGTPLDRAFNGSDASGYFDTVYL